MTDEPQVFTYYPADVEPLFKEGVTEGWVYVWSGEPGPARGLRVAALADEDGEVVIVRDGEWEDVTVVDDTATD